MALSKVERSLAQAPQVEAKQPAAAKRLGKVRQFATSNQIQIMVINIQSFQKDVADKDLSEMTEDELKKLNVINRENDRMSGRRPIEFIQAASPIVIIDEPQSVDTTEKSRRAIGNLKPMATLRYSATHRKPPGAPMVSTPASSAFSSTRRSSS